MTSPEPTPTPTRADVEQLTAANDAAMKALATQGIGIDQAGLNGVRLVALIEHLLGDLDDPRRLTYEHALQQRYAAIIADAASQVTRARLLQGVQLGNGRLAGQGH